MNSQQTETIKENPMKQIKLEKVVLSCGATGQNVEKSKKLLELLSNGRKIKVVKADSKRRIPNFGVKPGIELGTMVTIRGKEASEVLKKLLGAIDNFLSEEQIAENGFSFGIHEYIEIPGAEYKREIGIRGLNVTVVFIRPGVRVRRKKAKRGKTPERHHVQPEEIIKYMKENFETEVE